MVPAVVCVLNSYPALELLDSGSLSLAVTLIQSVLDFLMYGGTVTRGYMKFDLRPSGLSLLFANTRVEFPCFEGTELESFICWWVPYAPHTFCKRCLP